MQLIYNIEVFILIRCLCLIHMVTGLQMHVLLLLLFGDLCNLVYAWECIFFFFLVCLFFYRTYYASKILVPVPKNGRYPKKLVYKFGPTAHGWQYDPNYIY